ncbi:MAG: hypothetical protein BVN29_08045 [Nitrospira sp. ST-bin5]|nr:MAG: hypothetical protein BVN29_08045 [Nitrospira sp. ST-bin5]
MADSSILRGAASRINQSLGLQKGEKYGHTTTSLSLSKQPPKNFDGKALIEKILDRVKCNWHRKQSTGDQNWRWEKQLRTPGRNPRGKGQEVCLERLIVQTTNNDWVNQVPIASGLTRSGDRRRAIDLAHRSESNGYELIELKMGKEAGTALFAAMEILQYGIVYMFSRLYAKDLGYTVGKKSLLDANRICLQVLAPTEYYDKKRIHLGWLEEEINEGLRSFSKERNIQFQIDFEFQEFPPLSPGFHPCSLLKDLPAATPIINHILRGRTPVYRSS